MGKTLRKLECCYNCFFFERIDWIDVGKCFNRESEFYKEKVKIDDYCRKIHLSKN